MTDVWRPLTDVDGKEWVRLFQAAEAADRTGENLDAADFTRLVESTRVDFATGSVGVFRDDRLVAVGVVNNQPGSPLVSLDGVVHPEVRRTGIGRALLTELERLARASHAVPGQLLVSCHGDGKVKAAMLAAAGYTPSRWFFDMRCDLTASRPDVPVPDSMRLAPYPADDEPVRLAYNEFFAEHWGHQDFTPQAWHESTTGHAAQPELSFVLRDDAGDIVAMLISHYYAADHAQTGVRELWIADLGTRKSLRGKGLGTFMLNHALRRARAAGFARAALGVDVDNATGALGVYERAGFTVSARWTEYGKPI